MRLIDANLFNAELEKYEDKLWSYAETNTLSTIQDMLEDAPAINPYEWIDVDDRLPPAFTDVLCWYEYFRYGDYDCMYQTYGIGYYNDICGSWGGEVSNGYKARVLAWTPLPTPPTGKENKYEMDQCKR